MPIRPIYLGLAIWGAIHPMIWYVQWFWETGWTMGPMIDAWYANAAVTGLTWDLTIAALTLTVWVLIEAWRSRDWLRLVAIPATFGIGLSCGLPLYLFLRSR